MAAQRHDPRLETRLGRLGHGFRPARSTARGAGEARVRTRPWAGSGGVTTRPMSHAAPAPPDAAEPRCRGALDRRRPARTRGRRGGPAGGAAWNGPEASPPPARGRDVGGPWHSMKHCLATAPLICSAFSTELKADGPWDSMKHFFVKASLIWFKLRVLNTTQSRRLSLRRRLSYLLESASHPLQAPPSQPKSKSTGVGTASCAGLPASGRAL